MIPHIICFTNVVYQLLVTVQRNIQILHDCTVTGKYIQILHGCCIVTYCLQLVVNGHCVFCLNNLILV